MTNPETHTDPLQHLPAAGDVSEEPVPGAAYKLTPIQQLKPWNQQELADQPAEGSSNRAASNPAQGAAGTDAQNSTLGLFLFAAVATALIFGVLRRR